MNLIVFEVILPILRNKTIYNIFGFEKKKNQEFSKINDLINKVRKKKHIFKPQQT